MAAQTQTMPSAKKPLNTDCPHPKGLLILGIAGTGKSLTAKATAKVFGVPLLKLDAGRIFAGLVGQSESNLRAVIQTAEAIAPCCLWIDEVEKGFSGTKSSNATDGGTSSRVFGSLYQLDAGKSRLLYSSSPLPMTYPNCRPKCSGKAGLMSFSLWTCPIKLNGKRSGTFKLGNMVEIPGTSTWFN